MGSTPPPFEKWFRDGQGDRGDHGVCSADMPTHSSRKVPTVLMSSAQLEPCGMGELIAVYAALGGGHMQGKESPWNHFTRPVGTFSRPK